MTQRSTAQRSFFWTWYERLAMLIGLSSLALFCLAWFPFAMLLHPLLPKSTGARLGRLTIMLGFRGYTRVLTIFCACRFDLHELDQLRHQGPLIIASNHPSLLDAVLIASRLPNVVCVMKSSLMRHPLLGSAARLAHYIRNDGMWHIVQQSRDALHDGAQVLIFPEGTRTAHPPLNTFPPTLGLLATRSGVPVQCVVLEFSTPYLGKGWSLLRRPALPLHCRARLGQRFESPYPEHAALTMALESHWRHELAQVGDGELSDPT